MNNGTFSFQTGKLKATHGDNFGEVSKKGQGS